MNMPPRWPVSDKVMALKGSMSYRELEQEIMKKTGKRIAYGTLRQLAAGINKGNATTIGILAEYAGKPISWFYESDQPDTVAKAQELFFVPTGNPREDRRRLELYDMFVTTGRGMSLRDLEQLIKIARAMAVDDANFEKKKQ